MSHAPKAGGQPASRTVDEWAAHWNAKAGIENPLEVNGHCVGGVALDADLFRQAVVEPVLERLELLPHHHVLEVGCGSGLILDVLEARAERAVGTDLSEALIRRYQGGAEVIVCAAHELPFEGQEFDRILMASVSHYFPSLDYFHDVLVNLVSLLRPSGILVVSDMLLGRPGRVTQYRWYDPIDVIAALEPLDVGFSIEAQSALKRTINRRYDLVVRKV